MLLSTSRESLHQKDSALQVRVRTRPYSVVPRQGSRIKLCVGLGEQSPAPTTIDLHSALAEG